MLPYIICHMMQSLDGRVACDMVDKISGDEYYTALDKLGCQAHIEGKHSYQIHRCGCGEYKAVDSVEIGKETWFVSGRYDTYSVSADTRGTLLWENGVEPNHICMMSEKAPAQYLDYLKSLEISYIAVGKEGIDLRRAMEILHDEFGVERVPVVGGGKINGGFLAQGLIDEVSAMRLQFREVSTFPNGVIWVRYDTIRK